MGIIIHDEITLRSGIKVSNVYVSFASGALTIHKDSDTGKYRVDAVAYMWLDKVARERKAPKIDILSLQVVSDTVSDESIYKVAYAELKKRYTSTIDD